MLPTLSHFFAPLNVLTLSFFILIFIFFDILGTFVKNFFDKRNNSDSRILNWMIGFGVFVFAWFIASLLVPYTQKNILISIFILLSVSLPSYLKSNGFASFFKSFKNVIVPIIIIAPFLPAVFVKASLPPYYGDEMAYHYIPPQVLLDLANVHYTGGLYADLPRNLNLFWEIIFSLTNTYSVARLFHFTILATALIFTYHSLKNKFGMLVGVLFVFFFLSLPQDIVLTSTLGYIDVGAYSFLLVAVIFVLKFINDEKIENLYLSSIFWGLMLGTKYTGISNFVAFLAVLAVIFFIKRSQFNKYLTFKNILFVLSLFIFFGGYWYIKNFILYGNPIFPFIFNCWGVHVEPCPQSGGFFGDWTTKISLANASLIASQLFTKNIPLRISAVMLPFMIFLVKDKKVRLTSILLAATVLIEFLILKHFSGFYARYHQHLQLYLIAGVCLVLTSTFTNKFLDILRKIFLGAVILTSLTTYIYTVTYTNSLKFLNWNEITYSIGRINIYDWVKINFSKMNDVILWCDGGEGRDYVNLARFDPDLIWFDHDGLMRVFLIRCRYINPNIETNEIGKIIPSAIINKQKFWISSSNKCLSDLEVKPKFVYEKDFQSYLRKVDNKIICNSNQIIPNLYYFDYEKLKK